MPVPEGDPTMRRETYDVRFTTPAFLGDADQRAQWRTPPIKALLRQWWRVLVAKDCGYDVAELHRREGELFGNASDDEGGESRQSQVRIRLDTAWEEGALTQWPANEPKFHHPDVGRPVGTDLYLGYGPLTYEKGVGTTLGTSKSSGTKRSAIAPGTQRATLKIATPDDFPLDALMQLLARFGTLGSRARNGWGSLHLLPSPACGRGVGREGELPPAIFRPLDDCLTLDWPHALGTDARGPLIWETKPQADWRNAMKELARIKIAFRTQTRLSLKNVKDGQFAERHVLAYPVTHHAVLGPYDRENKSLGWVEAHNATSAKTDRHGYYIQSARLASQLRFKVIRREDGRMVGIAFHLPARVPEEMANRLSAQDRKHLRANEPAVWRAVHVILDQEMLPAGGRQ